MPTMPIYIHISTPQAQQSCSEAERDTRRQRRKFSWVVQIDGRLFCHAIRCSECQFVFLRLNVLIDFRIEPPGKFGGRGPKFAAPSRKFGRGPLSFAAPGKFGVGPKDWPPLPPKLGGGRRAVRPIASCSRANPNSHRLAKGWQDATSTGNLLRNRPFVHSQQYNQLHPH